MSNNKHHDCLECGQALKHNIYAIYSGKPSAKREGDQDEVMGYICDECRAKHKVKGLRGTNDLHKLKEFFSK